jgi:hypothetical protein
MVGRSVLQRTHATTLFAQIRTQSCPDEQSPLDRGCWRRGPARSDAFTIVAALLDDVGAPTSLQRDAQHEPDIDARLAQILDLFGGDSRRNVCE